MSDTSVPVSVLPLVNLSILPKKKCKKGEVIPDNKGKRLSNAMHWVFTYNNPPDDFIQLLHVVHEIKAFVVQKEVGQCGTPHLQGYIEFKRRVRAPAVIDWTSKIYWQVCKSIPKAIAYCQKNDTRVAGPWFKGLTPALFFYLL